MGTLKKYLLAKMYRHRWFLGVVGILLGVVSLAAVFVPAQVKQATPMAADQLQAKNAADQSSIAANDEDNNAKKLQQAANYQWQLLVKKKQLKHTNTLEEFQKYYHQSPAAYLATHFGYSVNESLLMVPPALQTSGEQKHAEQLRQKNALQ